MYNNPFINKTSQTVHHIYGMNQQSAALVENSSDSTSISPTDYAYQGRRSNIDPSLHTTYYHPL